jgi:hypothetical protein
MAFIFDLANNEIQSGTLDILNGQFDISFVTVPPIPSNIVISNLTLSSLPSTPLVNNSTSNIWSYQNIILPLNSYSVAPIGFVISKRSSANFDSNNRVIYYSEFTNSIGQPITYTPGLYRINVNFNSSGLINFNATNEYFSGAYAATEPVPKGLIYLLGTNNNTVAFVNPDPTKFVSRYLFGGGTGQSGTGNTDRNAANFGGTPIRRLTFSFINRRVRLGQLGFILGSASSIPITLSATNDITVFNETNIAAATWTTLSTLATRVVGWNFMNSTDLNYWQYFKIELGSDNFDPSEIEFYNSSILSSTLNLV